MLLKATCDLDLDSRIGVWEIKDRGGFQTDETSADAQSYERAWQRPREE